jgi:hypothetical protein
MLAVSNSDVLWTLPLSATEVMSIKCKKLKDVMSATDNGICSRPILKLCYQSYKLLELQQNNNTVSNVMPEWLIDP